MAPTEPSEQGSVGQGSGYAYRILKFAAGSVGLDSVQRAVLWILL